jgi:hypothetical protein
VLPLAALPPEWGQKMTTPARTATSAAAAISGTSGRRERRGPPGAGASRSSPSIAVDRSSDRTGPGPSTRVTSGSAGGGCTPPGGAGHGCGPGGGHRGAYHESQDPDPGCGSPAAAGGTDGTMACGQAGAAGNGAADCADGAVLPATGCPQTGHNPAPGGTGCPHAGLPEPAAPAIVTAG